VDVSVIGAGPAGCETGRSLESASIRETSASVTTGSSSCPRTARSCALPLLADGRYRSLVLPRSSACSSIDEALYLARPEGYVGYLERSFR
jgi:hypothetical protein